MTWPYLIVDPFSQPLTNHASLFMQHICIYVHIHPRPLPEDPGECCSVLLKKLTAALTESKILPIKLLHLKHQESLRILAFQLQPLEV